MKLVVFLIKTLLVVSLAGCIAPNPSGRTSLPMEPEPNDIYSRTMSRSEVPQIGKNTFLDIQVPRPKIEILVRKILNEESKNRGLNLTNQSVKANLVLSVVGRLVNQKEYFSTKIPGIKTSSPEVATDKEGRILIFDFSGYSQAYGKRSRHVFSVTAFLNPEGAGLEELLIERFRDWLGLALADKKIEEVKAKGDPGCTPRFGFEGETKTIDKIIREFRITEVIKSSAAEAAGLRVGDILQSIAGYPYEDGSFANNPRIIPMYENFETLPIILMRDKKIIKIKIKAKIWCGEK